MSKEKQIIDTAIRLFVDRGIQGTSMSLLAKEANVAAGSIYNYFSSKEDLINKIFLFSKKLEVEYITENYDKNLSIEQRFDSFYGASIKYMMNNPLPFKFFELYCFSPIILDETREQLRDMYSDLLEFYEDAGQMNILKPFEPLFLHLQVYGSLSSVIHWKLHHAEDITEDDIQRILQIAWDGIKNHSQETLTRENSL